MSEPSNPIGQSVRDAATALLKSRRTIHEFDERVPPSALIHAAVDHARWAPNHYRTEPWRFYLIEHTVGLKIAALNAELVRAKSGEVVAESKLRRWSAMPGWLTITCALNPDSAREREDYAACCCAAQNLMLYLWAHGVGMKWGTGKVIRDPRFFEILGADPLREFAIGLFWYGYPSEVPVQTRRPVSEVLCTVAEH
ncbi:MAG: nitroreductase [Gammaproteobacteria bacterium]|nr:nitroreductase [Gammaproteobacteria bacterium]